MKLQSLTFMLLSMFVIAPSHAQTSTISKPPESVPAIAIEKGKEEEKHALKTGSFQLEGIASYYGKKFHKKTTANGESFNMHAYTAAHRTLPFNTVVQVTNLSNGKTVNVRINDRGPYIQNRVIDLSKKAAEKIAMIKSGTTPVSLKIIHLGKISGDTKSKSFRSSSYDHPVTIQIASYSSLKGARHTLSVLKQGNIQASIEKTKKFYRVIMKNIAPHKVTPAIETLKTVGFSEVLIRKY